MSACVRSAGRVHHQLILLLGTTQAYESYRDRMWELEDFTEIRRWYALHLLLCVTFFISGVIINAVQFLLYVTLRPFNKSLYCTLNYYLIYSLMSQVLFLAEWWSGSEIRVFTSDEAYQMWGKEHALIIMNHTYEVDWLMGWIVADRSHTLGKMMQYVPTIGWAWRLSDIIFLNRNWQEDKTIMQTQIKEFFDYPYPVWMLLFAEGTRFTPAKHEASMEFARKRGLPELKRHLIPRTRGFIQCAQSLKGNFPVIYDVTVGFNTKEGEEPSLQNMLRGRKVMSEIYIRRLPLDEVPDDDEGASKYLHELYRSKDQLLDSYINTGSFTEENDLPKYSSRAMPRRPYSLLNMIGWASFVLSQILRFYYNLITSGSLISISFAVGIVIFAYLGLYKMIGLTKIDKGSQYGSTDTNKKD
ncbi:1-acyl-sn-glycerol-3-phosphate acyltransferase delta-like [Homarus americanus]|uniref:1-acyl-sn-glycerol-3-phosphate acyltransferase delta-like n=1 Tax=Homarus americanus TaxID=6706 RepID=A0A8J5K1X8_HOMAM|nr:1-acyl-sn-glycerol-3-phosphate acyltransferase delta-like [Homarus americanus]